MPRTQLLLLSALLAVLPFAARAQAPTGTAWLDDVRRGGYVIVLRHGATTSEPSKVDSMSRPNVPADRQLSERGRAQAKAIGQSKRKLNIPVGLVMASTVQRALDTATLLELGEVRPIADLAESGPAIPPEESKRRAEAFRKLIGTQPPADKNVVIVSHKPNIIDALGEGWSDVHEGEASIFQPAGNGSYRLITRIQADGWNALTGAPQ
ncbi:histidine phosphatase family protein [Bradyrhizobium sp. STM 3557]|uniref:histidine phosphatase family protein n=1 Tax=Bradyrhizobium sp. STM 3557 TaxID=578920 RepID=UPI003890F66E